MGRVTVEAQIAVGKKVKKVERKEERKEKQKQVNIREKGKRKK